MQEMSENIISSKIRVEGAEPSRGKGGYLSISYLIKSTPTGRSARQVQVKSSFQESYPPREHFLVVLQGIYFVGGS